MMLLRLRTWFCRWLRPRTTCGDLMCSNPEAPHAAAVCGVWRAGRGAQAVLLCVLGSPPTLSACTGAPGSEPQFLCLQNEDNVALYLLGLCGRSREIRHSRSSVHGLTYMILCIPGTVQSTSPIFTHSLLTPLQGGYYCLNLAALNTSCALSRMRAVLWESLRRGSQT